jgi:DNA-binding transcriptional MerR regulator
MAAGFFGLTLESVRRFILRDTMKRNDVLTSGQLAAAAGVSPDIIRHYEKLGLLVKVERTDGGYRLFPPESLRRVRTIQSALKAGFSLAELAEIFKERDAGGAPCRRVARLARDKVSSLDQQIQELATVREWLARTVESWQLTLKDTPPGKPAGLLDSLVGFELPKNHKRIGPRQ